MVEASGIDSSQPFDSAGHSLNTIETLDQYLIGFLAEEDREDSKRPVVKERVVEKPREEEIKEDAPRKISFIPKKRRKEEIKEDTPRISLIPKKDKHNEGKNDNGVCLTYWIVGGICLLGIGSIIGLKYLKKNK